MRPLIAYLDGIDAPRTSPAEIARLVGVDGAEILLGWTPEWRNWLDDPELDGITYLAGYQLAKPVAAGRLRYLPLRLSAVPRFLERRRPAVAVVTGVRRGDGLTFGATAGFGPDLVRWAERVVVEVDEQGVDLGAPVIDGNIVLTIDRPPATDALPDPRPPDEVDLVVGRHVASVLPDGSTVQLGPGGIAEAIALSLRDPVSVWSGLVTDTMAGMADRGLLEGPITAAYVWGGEPVARLHAAGGLRLAPLSVTHDLTAVSAIPRFVACNTALQIGLDGSCNVETVGGRAVAGIGGNADFAVAAVRSPGGLSIMALKSTTKTGRSTIVPVVDAVSTPRCDVDLVVTEHGIADLRDADDAERARRIVEVADPAHRAHLRAAS